MSIYTERKTGTADLTKTAVLLGLALLFQIGFSSFAQPVVGPLVNMVLVMTVLTVSPGAAVIIGCLTPAAAFMLGIMPLAPALPVIMLGTSSLVLVFHRLYQRSQWLAILAGATAKFTVMALLIRILAYGFFPGLPAPLIATFTLPQLYTALAGGAMALIITRHLPDLRK